MCPKLRVIQKKTRAPLPIAGLSLPLSHSLCRSSGWWPSSSPLKVSMNDSLRSEPEVGLVGSRLGARVPRAARAGEERERERESTPVGRILNQLRMPKHIRQSANCVVEGPKIRDQDPKMNSWFYAGTRGGRVGRLKVRAVERSGNVSILARILGGPVGCSRTWCPNGATRVWLQ